MASEEMTGDEFIELEGDAISAFSGFQYAPDKKKQAQIKTVFNAAQDSERLRKENECLRRRIEQQDKLILGCGVIIGSLVETVTKIEELLGVYGHRDIGLAVQMASAVNSLVEARKELKEGENGE